MGNQVHLILVLVLVHNVLATDFATDVKWICDRERVTVVLSTSAPFHGIVHAKDSRLCAQNGTGETNIQWSWSLEDLKNCVLILEQDAVFQISCAPTADSEVEFSNDDFNTSSIEYTLRVPDSFRIYLEREEQEVDEILYGSSCFLKLQLLNDKQDGFGVRYKVKKCQAVAQDLTVVALTDDKGCPTSPSVMSAFQYDNGIATAKLPSMFRFPDDEALRIDCTVSTCSAPHMCKHFCDGAQDEPIKDLEVDETENLLTDTEKPGSTTAVASTSVKVVDRRQADLRRGAFEDQPDSSCQLSKELIILYRMCLCLCFLFVGGCLLNVGLCVKRCSKKKRRQKSSSLPASETNEFWIESVDFDNPRTEFKISQPEPHLPFRENDDRRKFKISQPEPHLPFRENDDRRSSFASYASFKKNNRSNQYGPTSVHRTDSHSPNDDVVFRISNNEFFGRTFHSNPVSVYSNSPDQMKHLSVISNDSIRSKRELHSLH
uniref:ZP domain-containing protein n=1 Tax=Steinernema glaseri TaxID=37863 RepID=A0A1I8A1V5_9BILA